MRQATCNPALAGKGPNAIRSTKTARVSSRCSAARQRGRSRRGRSRRCRWSDSSAAHRLTLLAGRAVDDRHPAFHGHFRAVRLGPHSFPHGQAAREARTDVFRAEVVTVGQARNRAHSRRCGLTLRSRGKPDTPG